MHAQTYASRYTQAQVTSVDRTRLLLLMFDGGLRFLRQARDGLVAQDAARFGEALQRAQAIVSELQATLDLDAGGEIARQLFRLYDFMLYHLTDANTEKSVRHLEVVIGLFETVAEAFREIIERPAA